MIRSARMTYGAPGSRLQRSRPEVDISMVAGLAALGGLIGLALYGPMLAPYDPYFAKTLLGGTTPPYDPSPTFPLGSDAAGRDRLSLLLYGARTTLAIAAAAAFVRFVLGGLLGVLAGSRRGALDAVLSRLALALSSVPGVLAAVLVILGVGLDRGAVTFVVALSLFGWTDAFHHARRATRSEVARPYVGSARALGVTEWRVLTVHVIPNVTPLLLTTAALQLSAVLLLMAELALLRLFVGGAVVTDISGTPTFLPAEPEWAALLAVTRPIYDVYTNAIGIIAPAAALLIAVLSIDLFADSLAGRAQRLDVFRLFGRRAVLAGAFGASLIALPAILWPGRLAAEKAYAAGIDVHIAAEAVRQLGAPTDGQRATELVRSRLGGDVLSYREPQTQPVSASLRIGDREVALGQDLEVLALRSGTASGELVYYSPAASFGRPTWESPPIFVIHTSTQQSLAFRMNVAARNGVGAVIVIDDARRLVPDASFEIPALRVRERVLADLLGRDLSATELRSARQLLPLGRSAAVAIQTRTVDVEGEVVVARSGPQRADVPLLVVAAGATPDADRGRYAAAVGSMIAFQEHLRVSPLPIDVLFIVPSAETDGDSALRTALRSLTPADRARLQMVVQLGEVRGALVMRPDQTSPQTALPGTWVAARVADAAAVGREPQRDLRLLRVVTSADARAATVVLDTGHDGKATASLGDAPRVLAILASYLARHPEELVD